MTRPSGWRQWLRNSRRTWARNIFQLHCAGRHGHTLRRSKVRRAELLATVSSLRPRQIAMEACGSARHWARQFQALGMEVRLISRPYVTAFVRPTGTTNDAQAIVEAACRPTMHFVPVKTAEQQDMEAIHRIREVLVHQRTR
jgi:transposase